MTSRLLAYTIPPEEARSGTNSALVYATGKVNGPKAKSSSLCHGWSQCRTFFTKGVELVIEELTARSSSGHASRRIVSSHLRGMLCENPDLELLGNRCDGIHLF